MLIHLIRNRPHLNAVTGRIIIDGHFICDTLENASTLIPTGTYPVRLTMSHRFGEVLPLLDHVIGRTGIRIHPGNTARDSSGCILVGSLDDLPKLSSSASGLTGEAGPTSNSASGPRLLRSRVTFNALRETLLTTQRNHETIFITITEPDAHPLYNHPCPKRDRMYND